MTIDATPSSIRLLDGERVVRIYDSGDRVRDWYGAVSHHVAHGSGPLQISDGAMELAQGFTLLRLQMKGKTPKLVPFKSALDLPPVLIPLGEEWGWGEYLAAVTGSKPPSRGLSDDELLSSLRAAGFAGGGRELSRSLPNGYAVEVAQGASRAWTATLLIPRGNSGSKKVTVAVVSVGALLERVREAELMENDTQAAEAWQKR